MACRAVLAFPDAAALQRSQLLEVMPPGGSWPEAGGKPGVQLPSEACQLLEWLPQLREWALFAALMCPGTFCHHPSYCALHPALCQAAPIPATCMWCSSTDSALRLSDNENASRHAAGASACMAHNRNVLAHT